jgi:hypothetical protein
VEDRMISMMMNKMGLRTLYQTIEMKMQNQMR